MIRIFSPVCKNLDFIEIQLATFRRHLKDDHELIVINDGMSPDLKNEIDYFYDTIKEVIKILN